MRDRGMFTQRERSYLLGETDIESKSRDERAIRQSIRGHLLNAIKDFAVAFEGLEPRDRQLVFDDIDVLRKLRERLTTPGVMKRSRRTDEETVQKGESGEILDRGIRQAMALFYLAYTDFWGVESGHEQFEEVVADATKQAIEYSGPVRLKNGVSESENADPLVHVDTNISITWLEESRQAAVERFERGEEIHEEVLRQLIAGGHIDLSSVYSPHASKDTDGTGDEE